jgi:MFS family permease
MWLLGRLAMIADTGQARERGRQITTMSAMESAGRLFSPAVGGYLAGLWDIRAPFIAHAILSLIAIIPSFKLVQETAPELAQKGGNTAKGIQDGGFTALFTCEVIIFFVAQFLASLTRGPIFSGQLNLYGAYAYDMTPQSIGILATVVTAVGIPISLAAGYIMDHFGRKATLVPGFSLLTASLIFLSLTAYLNWPLKIFLLAYILVNASNSITGSNMQTLGSDIAPDNARGRFYGVWNALGTVGSPASTSIFAVLSAGMGYWSAFGFLALMACSTAFILGTQVRDRVREKLIQAAAAAR